MKIIRDYEKSLIENELVEEINLRDLAIEYNFKYDSVAEIFISKNQYIEISKDGSKYQLFNNVDRRQYNSEYFHLFSEDVVNADKLIKRLRRES